MENLTALGTFQRKKTFWEKFSRRLIYSVCYLCLSPWKGGLILMSIYMDIPSNFHILLMGHKTL